MDDRDDKLQRRTCELPPLKVLKLAGIHLRIRDEDRGEALQQQANQRYEHAAGEPSPIVRWVAVQRSIGTDWHWCWIPCCWRTIWTLRGLLVTLSRPPSVTVACNRPDTCVAQVLEPQAVRLSAAQSCRDRSVAMTQCSSRSFPARRAVGVALRYRDGLRASKRGAEVHAAMSSPFRRMTLAAATAVTSSASIILCGTASSGLCSTSSAPGSSGARWRWSSVPPSCDSSAASNSGVVAAVTDVAARTRRPR